MMLLAAVLLAPQAITVRISKVDVTPPEMLPLGGYTARGDKLMEPGGEQLFARTIVFQQGDRKVALVSIEALTIPESFREAVKSRMPKDVDLMLVATHTHSAPDSQMLNERMTFRIPGIAPFNRRWLDWYADRVSSGIEQALKAEAHSGEELKFSQTEVEANRGRRQDAKPIRTATSLVLAGKPLLLVYAAHGTVLDDKNLKTSGDWMGAWANKVGGLVLPGAIGDVSPAPSGSSPVENLAFMVEKLRSRLTLAEVKRLLRDGSVLGFLEEPIALDKAVPHPAFAKEFGANPPLDQILISRFAPPQAAVTLLQLGPLLLIGIPGEPTSDLGRQIGAVAAKNGFPQTVVVSHTNGWIGYVLMPVDYDRGGYEAALSFNGRETAERILEAVERAVKKLAQPEPRVAHTR